METSIAENPKSSNGKILPFVVGGTDEALAQQLNSIEQKLTFDQQLNSIKDDRGQKVKDQFQELKDDPFGTAQGDDEIARQAKNLSIEQLEGIGIRNQVKKELIDNLAEVRIWYNILIQLVNYLSSTLRCEIKWTS